jgi:hypothetical protein
VRAAEPLAHQSECLPNQEGNANGESPKSRCPVFRIVMDAQWNCKGKSAATNAPSKSEKNAPKSGKRAEAHFARFSKKAWNQ